MVKLVQQIRDQLDDLCLSDEEVRQKELEEMARMIREDKETMHAVPAEFAGLGVAPLG